MTAIVFFLFVCFLAKLFDKPLPPTPRCPNQPLRARPVRPLQFNQAESDPFDYLFIYLFIYSITSKEADPISSQPLAGFRNIKSSQLQLQ